MGRRAKLGAGFRRRADGRLEYRWTENGSRYSVTGTTIEECKEKELEKRKLISKNVLSDIQNASLDEYFKEWTRSRENTVSSSTIRTNKTIYIHISNHLGKMKVRSIERRHIQRFLDALKEKHSSTYVNTTRTLLYSILESAKIDGLIDNNPCEGVKRIKRTEKQARETIHRALTIEETKRFFQAAKDTNSWYYDLYDFLIHTGCRIGEAGALMNKDIDFNNSIIHIRRTLTNSETGYEVGDRAKTAKGNRDIPMTNQVKDILSRQIKRNVDAFGENSKGKNERVFKTIYGKFVTGSSQVWRDMKSLVEIAGIEYCTIHSLRDTFATRAIESGMNPQTLKEILGHSSFTMTMDLYAHVMEDTKRREMDLLKVR